MSEDTEQPGAGAPESTAALFGDGAASPETQTSDKAAPEAAEGGEQPGLLGEVSPEEQALTAEELEEIEYEGKTAKVPKELKDAFLRHKDYTQKTQDHADRVRAAEAQYAAKQQYVQLQEATIQESAHVLSIDQRLKQYEQVAWDDLSAKDPALAMKLDREMRQLQAQRMQLSQGIAQKHQALAFQQQQQAATRLEEGRRELERDIKGWSPELAGKLMQTAKSLGFRDEELANVSDPRTVKLLHEAHLYRQLMAKQSARPPAAPLPKPVTKVGGGSASNTKTLSDLSPEEWAARRNEQRYAKRR